ncbi:diguanylate cyclase [Paenibacillus validus]|uniref:Diguanylate cyclase n=2 Tax=Paenibacillus TaxID=44249 RepID=A0A7X3CRV9_9BACL|nr:diguanylate cyclase [Paenibacillus validus]
MVPMLEHIKEKTSDYLLTLIQIMPDIIVFKDGKGAWVEANDAALQLFELDRDAYKGKTNLDFQRSKPHMEEFFHTCEETDNEAWRRGKTIHFEEKFKRSDGSTVIIEFIKEPVMAEDGRREWLIVVGRDITERKLIQDHLNEQNVVLEMVAKGRPLQDILGHIIEFVEKQTEAVCSILLLENDLLKHGMAPRLPASFLRAVDGIRIGPDMGSCGTAAYYNKNIIVSDIENDPLWRDFREIALDHGFRACWSVPFTDKDNQVIGTFAIYYKTRKSPETRELQMIERSAYLIGLVIERNKAEETIRKLAFFDSLTELPNRKSFQHILEKTMAEAKQKNQLFAVLYLDLDGFKFINDSMGHSVGDLLLQRVSQRLQDLVSDKGIVSRQGGDEFTILLPNTSKAETEAYCQKIMEALNAPFHIQDHDLYISTSIGISMFPFDGETIEALVKNADMAMYHAKRQGRNHGMPRHEA